MVVHLSEGLLGLPKEELVLALSYMTGRDLPELRGLKEIELNEEEFKRLIRIAQDRIRGIPLQYAIGEWNFYGYDFIVNPFVLIPRPETELLVEWAIDHAPSGAKVLDLCTGSGSIAIALAMERVDLEISASDLSDKALEVARINAERLGAKVSFYHGDLFEGVRGERYGVILSNPPYISEADYEALDRELFREPKMALVAGAEGMDFYLPIVDEGWDYLVDGGLIGLEIGYNQGNKVEFAFGQKGFHSIIIHRDYNGLDRFVTAIKTHKGEGSHV